MDKRFLTEKSPDRVGPVENFIKGDENLFFAVERLPENFSFGFMVSLVWVASLLLLLKNAFDRFLTPRLLPPEKELRLDLKNNKIRTFVAVNRDKIKRIVAGIQYLNPRVMEVPGWDSLPGNIKVEWFFSFFNLPLPETLQPVSGKYCDHNLTPDDKAMIISEIIRHFDVDIFVFTDFLNGLSDNYAGYFLELIGSLKKDRHIVYFTSSVVLSGKIGDKMARYHDGSLL